MRGNGPTSVTYGDAMLTLVDNAFDVRMQDIEIEEGDCFQGFTKRQSVASVMNRMLTTQSFRVLNKAGRRNTTEPFALHTLLFQPRIVPATSSPPSSFRLHLPPLLTV